MHLQAICHPIPQSMNVEREEAGVGRLVIAQVLAVVLLLSGRSPARAESPPVLDLLTGGNRSVVALGRDTVVGWSSLDVDRDTQIRMTMTVVGNLNRPSFVMLVSNNYPDGRMMVAPEPAIGILLGAPRPLPKLDNRPGALLCLKSKAGKLVLSNDGPQTVTAFSNTQLPVDFESRCLLNGFTELPMQQ